MVASAEDVAAYHTKVAAVLMMIIQCTLIGCFCLAKYGEFNPDEYQAYMGIALMMLVGFGYLMAFLKMYGLGAVGFTFVLTCLCVQLNVLIAPVISEHPKQPVLSAGSFMDGNFAAATILVSFGCIIGKASPSQLVLMAVIESFLFQINRNLICVEVLYLEDAGGTIVIHMFGAYFGLALAKVLGKPAEDKYCTNSIVSDLLSLIGTVFLWLYWPSFNGGGYFAHDRADVFANRCVVNTVVALCSSCVTSFAISGFLSKRFSPADVQNATLAGGVAVGAIARMDVEPAWAAGMGMFASVVSVWGYQRLQPFLLEKFGLHDSCGVHNLHGMPSMIGGLISVVAVAAVHNSPEYVTRHDEGGAVDNSRGTQALYQFLCICSTLGIAIVGGAMTGYILKAFDKMMANAAGGGVEYMVNHFTDAVYWNVGETKLTGSDLSMSTKYSKPQATSATVAPSP